MRKILLIIAMLTGGSLYLLTGSPVLAQVPSSQQPSAGAPSRSSVPSSNPPMSERVPGTTNEVTLGKLAAEKGSTDAVKQFGQRMVDDHTKANEELKKIATAQSLSIPDSIDKKHQSRVDKLSKLTGAEFDRAYIKDQLKDHQQDVREFQDEAQNGSDAAVKDFAGKTLPTLQEHLAMVKELNKEKKTATADRSK